MRVCYVLSTSEVSGGANKSFIELVSNLDREIIEPFVLLRRRGEIEKVLYKLRIPYKIIPYTNYLTNGNVVKSIFKKLMDFFCEFGIKRYLLKNKVDIVHNNSLPALRVMIVAGKINIPYICHIRENVEKGLGVRFINKKKHYQVIKNAYTNIAISYFILEDYQRDIPEAKFIVYKDGFEVNNYYLSQKKILEKKIIIISIYGNLDDQKDQICAIRAIEFLNNDNIKLRIIGNNKTEYGEKLKNLVADINITNVEFVDTISSLEKLRRSREEDDINLVCSRAEGMGRVTIESMLSGCVTIAAAAGATTEILEDGVNGFLYKTGDYKDLASKIDYVVSHREVAQRIAEKARGMAVLDYNIETYVNKMMDLYIRIMKDK